MKFDYEQEILDESIAKAMQKALDLDFIPGLIVLEIDFSIEDEQVLYLTDSPKILYLESIDDEIPRYLTEAQKVCIDLNYFKDSIEAECYAQWYSVLEDFKDNYDDF